MFTVSAQCISRLGVFFPVLIAAALFQVSNVHADTESVQHVFALSKKYEDVRKFMQDIVSQHPQHAQIFDLGVSNSGVMIQGLKIGKNEPGAIKNLVVATHHGNEYGSTEVAKSFAASIAENPIPGQTVYVIPVLNTSGFDSRSRWEKAGGMSHDPNRDYPGPCGSYGPFKLKSTQALAQFVEKEGIVTSATLHTFYPAVVYPWGMTTNDLSTSYDDLFKLLTQAATVESKYPIGNATKVIYPANGTFEDYAFWKHGIWSLLFELGHSHSPSENSVKDMIKLNVPGIRRFLEEAPRARAEKHQFNGQCDRGMLHLDRFDE